MVKFTKIVTSIILSAFFGLAIALSIYVHWGQNLTVITLGIMIFLIFFNTIMFWYVNWAIWTKGKTKKVVMSVIIIGIILLLCIILTYE